MNSGFRGFPPETRKFLRQLARNNNREWFLAHKDVYVTKVKEPMIELVTALGGAIQSFAPEMVADPGRNIYRIYRDTRFSPDKTPYKTLVSALFWPRGFQKHACASLYFHFGTSELLIAGGVYMPGPAELRMIRRHISDHWEEFRTIIRGREFERLFGSLGGDQLARPPRDFPADHPAVDLLRYKQFLAWRTDPPELVESPRLFGRLVTAFAAMMPFIRFLNSPLLMKPPIETN
jgi:uncharacterized protein (TIGR02453 family)